MPDDEDRPVVLIVDDEPEIVDLYERRLTPTYSVRTAYGGTEALEEADETIDIVLLDRRMPDLSGDDVLEALRERGLTCRVIMTTAVDPELDIVEMPFDDYLCKPIDYDDLEHAIEQQLQAADYEAHLSEYFAAVAKLQVLEDSVPQSELESDEAYQALRDRAATLRESAEASLTNLDPIVAFQQIDRGSKSASTGDASTQE